MAKKCQVAARLVRQPERAAPLSGPPCAPDARIAAPMAPRHPRIMATSIAPTIAPVISTSTRCALRGRPARTSRPGTRPARALEGQTPLDFAETEAGAREVESSRRDAGE